MKVVCFGDNLTVRREGYPKSMLTMMLSEKLKGHHIINAGVSSSTTESAKKRMKEEVLAYHPEIVVMLFGSNDSLASRNISLQMYKDNLLYFIKKIGYKKIILITPPPVDEDKQDERNNATLRQYAAVVKEVAAEQKCDCIDFFEHVISNPNYKLLLVGMSNDGFHFGEKLYDELSDLIANKIKARERKAESSIWSKITGKNK